MFLHFYAPFGKLRCFFVGKAVLLTVRERHVHLCSPLFGINKFYIFLSEILGYNRLGASFKRGFPKNKFIRNNGALHYHFSQTVRTVYNNHFVKTGFGINRKSHAARSHVRTHHFLHANRKRDVKMGKPFIGAVRYRPVRKKRSDAALNVGEELVRAAHVQKSLLLTGERSTRQIFGRRRCPHRNINVLEIHLLQFFVRAHPVVLQVGRKFGGQYHFPHGRPLFLEVLNIVGVKIGQRLFYLILQPRLFYKVAISVRGNRKAIRYLDIQFGKGRVHLAQSSVFASHDWRIPDFQILKPADKGFFLNIHNVTYESTKYYECTKAELLPFFVCSYFLVFSYDYSLIANNKSETFEPVSPVNK